MIFDWPHYHAQCMEDRRIRMAFPNMLTGVFVDVGAGEPITCSNTYHFEQNGWTGVLIDPDQRRCDELRRWRSQPVEQVAVASVAGNRNLHLSNWPGLSTLQQDLPEHEKAGTAIVMAVRLQTILDRHGIGRIDLLSIDTEGTEIDVCDSFDWDRHTPQIVIIEWATVDRPGRESQVRKAFQQRPYREIVRTECNLIFKRVDGPF